MHRTPVALLFLTLGLTACTDKTYERGSGVDNRGDKVLVGSVSTSDSTALPKHGTIIVLLMDESETVISRQELDIGNNPVPIGYRLRYDDADIQPTRRYYVAANVESHNDTKWKSDRTPVLTEGGLTNNVPIVVHPTP